MEEVGYVGGRTGKICDRDEVFQEGVMGRICYTEDCSALLDMENMSYCVTDNNTAGVKNGKQKILNIHIGHTP